MKSFLCAMAVIFLPMIAMSAPARIIMIRHAEKPASSSDDLSKKGYERAAALAGLFDLQPQLASLGLPVALFAHKYIPDQSSNRAIETLTPLAQKLGLEIQSPVLPEDFAPLAQQILADHSYSGKLIMLAWKHSAMQGFAQSLGASQAPAWDSSVFDRIWQLDYDSSGHLVSFQDLPQNLMPGDSLR